MDDDEPLPGTSKEVTCRQHSKASLKNSNSSKQLSYRQRSKTNRNNSNSEVCKDGNITASDTSVSNSVSENSHIEMGQVRMGNKVPTSRKDPKPKEQKKKVKRSPIGRVAKRPRRVESKKLARGRTKRPNRERKRHFSVSTVFTKLSSGEPKETCPYCGHRCCMRRYYSYVRKVPKYSRRRIRNSRMRKLKPMGTQTVARKTLKRRIQVGSRCVMLSPLCVNTGGPPSGAQVETQDLLNYCEISPEMIIQSLRRLSMMRAAVETSSILEHLKCNYPVGCDPKLYDELAWKLHIATRVGIVEEPFPGKWALTCPLMRRKLDKSHVTLFWNLYRNSLIPVRKKPHEATQDEKT